MPKAGDVEPLAVDLEPIAGCIGEDEPFPGPFDLTAQACDVAAQPRWTRCRWGITPHEVDELVPLDRLARRQSEAGEQQSLSSRRQLHGVRVADDLQRPEHVDRDTTAGRCGLGRASGSAPEPLKLILGHAQSSCEPGDRCPPRLSGPALFEITDGGDAHSSPVGELVLGEAVGATAESQQLAEVPRRAMLE
jgi:hypothetical protein